MVAILLAMVGIVLLAALVVVYVAYPHRGQDVPNAPWVGEAMRKGARLLPTLDHADRMPARPGDGPGDGVGDRPGDGPGDGVGDRPLRPTQTH
jgi:hypothetical protein